MNIRNQAEIKNITFLFALGFSTSLTQVILLREFLAIFGGNEIITSLFLSLWMLITGLGSFLAGGRYAGRHGMNAGLLFTGYVPLMLLILMNILRSVMFLPGVQPGMTGIALFVIIILPLFCLLSGFMFTYLASSLSLNAGKNLFSTAYGAESAGSLTGGLLFTFILSSFLDNYECAAITALMVTITVLSFEIMAGFRLFASFLAVLIIISGTLFMVSDISVFSRQFIYPGQEIIRTTDTRYGNLTVTQTAGQYNFYSNNNFLYATGDVQASEESVHFAMPHHKYPESVLLISGGMSEITNEVLKYSSVTLVDLVEPDPEIFRLFDEISGLDEIPALRLHMADALVFLRQNDKPYDIIIMNLSEPSTIEFNNYYTLEFFNLIKSNLNPGGIFSFSLPASLNYLNDQARQLNTSVYSTLAGVFGNIKIYPLTSLVYVATDSGLDLTVRELTEFNEINNKYVNPYFIDEFELERRSEIILKDIGQGGRINVRFRPVIVYSYLSLWMSKYNGSKALFRYFLWILPAIVIITLIISKRLYTGVFSAGFTSASAQIILILAFQVLEGHIYQALGAFVAVFMTGLAAGAMLYGRPGLPDQHSNPVRLQLYITAVACLIPVFILMAARLQNLRLMVSLLFFIPLFSISLLTGLTYASTVKLAGKTHGYRAGIVYGADLAGAALGAVITGLVIIPLSGIIPAAFLFAGVNLLTAVKLFYKP